MMFIHNLADVLGIISCVMIICLFQGPPGPPGEDGHQGKDGPKVRLQIMLGDFFKLMFA